jgi:superfamily I DNA and/or RNA helicase/very-short-patch-repair endonuclease
MPNQEKSSSSPSEDLTALNGAPDQKPTLLDKLWSRLQIARDRLVDRNLRNRLISTNLNSSRTKNIRFSLVKSEDIFNTLHIKKSDMQFNALGEGQEDELEDLDAENSSATEDSNQLNTRLEKDSLQKKLKSLYFEAQEYEEEQGVNILFVALGFIKWYEDDTSEIDRYAPLVLLPVELVRDGAKDKFRLKPRDEDLFTNISLKLWLKEQNSIELPDIPEEDAWSFTDYCTKVRHAIAKENRWEVIENEAVIGFFSFNKFLLWRDLDPANWPEGKSLLEHPIVQRLLMPPNENNDPDAPIVPNDELIDDYFTPQDLVYVVDADSSQTEAIQMVLSGKDMVIQGPPGTGKSQTITNIIAAAVANGKKVLFIAEKMAALNVVHDRLSKAGLGVTCLELHSRKATKSGVLKQIRDSVEYPEQQQVSSKAFEVLTESQTFLNKHAKRVNQSREPWGLNAYEVMGEIAKTHRLGLNIFSFSIPDASTYTNEKLATLSSRLKDLSERLKKSGIPENHPWRLSTSNPLTPMDVERLEIVFQELKDQNDSVELLLNIIWEALSIEINSSDNKKFENFKFSDFKWLFEITEKIKSAPNASKTILLSEKLRLRSAEIGLVASKIQKYKQLKTTLDSQFIDGWQTLPLNELRIRLAGSGGSIFSIFNSVYRESIASLKGVLKQSLPNGFKNRIALLDCALDLNKLKIEIQNSDTNLTNELGEVWNFESSNESLLSELSNWYVIFTGLNHFKTEIAINLIDNFSALENVEGVKIAILSFKEKLEAACSSAKINNFNIEELEYSELSQKVKAWSANLNRFNEWPSVRNHLDNLLIDLGKDCLQKIYKGEIQADYIETIVRSSILEKIWQEMIESDTNLSDIDAFKLDRELERFRKADKERLKIAALEVLGTYSNNCPRGNNGEMAIIRQEMSKKRNNFPVRKLLSKAGKAIHELKPVFLMSPMSIAQFIAPGTMTFDLVLIDEASQVKPEDALGAIARARQVVVVGDAKQLPPTNFFNRLTDESDQEELLDDDGAYFFSDVESILGLCDGVFQNNAMLRWHYRSQHPGLIAVSNRNFYDNKLLLPPSVLRTNYDDGLGVSFVKSPQNGYKRGGSEGGRNLLEAELIAKEVIEFAKAYPKKSLGVAAFSVTQRDAIRDLVDEYRRKNPKTEQFFSDSKSEHFFVKNLESIQGDERDVIFISVGYGRSEDGRLTQTFGPLAAEGGERRLNVLISRAKERCTVFSSITAEDVKAAPGKLGVNAFKEFLQFAEKGYFDVPIDTEKGFDSDFEESVAIFLTKHGYKVQPQVGMAGFFIDIGVVDPNNENRFYCGIECDGATYHSSRSARDRDRLRQEILESRGWKIYRIWSTDWFHRRSDQESKLLDYLSSLQNSDVIEAVVFQDVVPTSDIFEPISIGENSKDQILCSYIEYDEKELITKNLPHSIPVPQRSILVTKIVEIEGPIHQDEVARRLAKSFGLEKAGDRIKAATLEGLKGATSLSVENDFWSIAGETKKIVRNRSKVVNRNLEKAEYLPPSEIRTALEYLVRSSVQIEYAELVQQVSRLFGFQRCGPDLKTVIGKELDHEIGKTFLKNDQYISFNR